MGFDTGISIADNPIFKAVGSAMGVDGLFEPKAATTPPPMVTPKAGASSVEGAKVDREFRQHAPVAKPASTRGSNQGGGPGPMNLPGVMDPAVLQHPMVQQLLSQYGISPDEANSVAQHANPNLFIDNEQAFQKHPVLSNAIERGLEGLAFTKGGANPGETMSNIAQGLLNAKAARADKFNNQLMMPFAEAQQVAGLKNLDLETKFKIAQSARDEALRQHYQRMDDRGDQMADIRQQMADNQEQHFKDMADNQRMQRLGGLMGDFLKAPMDAAGVKEFTDEIGKHGGDWTQMDPGVLAKIMSDASDRRFKSTEAGKNNRAALVATTGIKKAQITSGTKPASTADLKAAYDQSSKEFNQFNKDLDSGMAIGSDGKMYVPGQAAAKAAKDALKQKMDADQKAWRDAINQGQPGSSTNIRSTTITKGRTYDPKTGTFK